MNNIVIARFLNSRVATAHSQWQYDYGQILDVQGIDDLPSAFEAHFANAGAASTITQIGTNGQVVIPDQCFLNGKRIDVYIYLHTGADDGETEYHIIIPVNARPQPSDTPPTPVQQDAITQAIAALNDAVEAAETAETNAQASAADAAENAQDAAASAVLAESWAVGETDTREGENQNNAKFWALVAQQGAEHSGYAIFDVNNQDGQMYVTITDPLAQDVSFLVNENLGTLEVTING